MIQLVTASAIGNPPGAYAASGAAAMPSVAPAGHRLLDQTNTLVVLGLGTAALLTRDLEHEGEAARLLDGSPFDGPIDIADRYGEGYTLGGAALGFMLVGRATGNPRLTDVGEDLGSSLLAAWSVTWALKVAVNAKRPNGGPYSFPSGHTATAFAAAPVFRRHFGATIGYASYAVAAMTGLARLEDRKHYVSDVLAGAAIGIVAGRTFSEEGALQWTIPSGGPGLGLTLRF